MDIKEIIKSAPDGATRYKVFAVRAEYYGLIGGNWCFYEWGTNKWKVDGFRNHVDAIPLPTRTKVEYVECDFSREWEAVKYYNEVGELFVFDLNGSYTNVNDIAGAWYEVVCKNYTRLYRRIEIPITEREEFVEKACDSIRTSAQEDIDIIGKLYDAGCRFVGE